MILKDQTINIGYDDAPIIVNNGDVVDNCIITSYGSNRGRFIFTEDPPYTLHLGAQGGWQVTNNYFSSAIRARTYVYKKESIRSKINRLIKNFYIFKNCRYL